MSLGTRKGLKQLQRCSGWGVPAQGCGCSLRIRSCPIPHSSQSLQRGAGCDPQHFVSLLMQNPRSEDVKGIKALHWTFSYDWGQGEHRTELGLSLNVPGEISSGRATSAPQHVCLPPSPNVFPLPMQFHSLEAAGWGLLGFSHAGRQFAASSFILGVLCPPSSHLSFVPSKVQLLLGIYSFQFIQGSKGNYSV